MKIVSLVLEVIGCVVLAAVWACGLYLRGGYRNRDHKADVDTLFSGRK